MTLMLIPMVSQTTAFTVYMFCEEWKLTSHFNANWQPDVMHNTTSDQSHLLHVNLRCFLLLFTSSQDYSDLWCEKQQTGKNIKPPKKNQTLAKQYKISKYLWVLLCVACVLKLHFARMHCYFWMAVKGEQSFITQHFWFQHGQTNYFSLKPHT